MSASVGIVVPNYNGGSLLPQYLPSVLDALQAVGGGEILVVDDASTDNSLEVLRCGFPGVRVLVQNRNQGFGDAVNAGAAALQTELMAVCMTDIQMEPDSLANACDGLSNDDVFAVGLTLMERPGAGNAGVTCLPFSRGFFHTAFPDSEAPGAWAGRPFHVAFATGGAMIVRRSRFLEIGGFDPGYCPFNWEDVDLCWRAWQRGWRVVSHPAAIAWHRHPHITVSANSSRERVDRVLWRNRILFVRKNISDRGILARHFVWLALISAKAAVRRNAVVRRAWREARDIMRGSDCPAPQKAYPDRVLMDYLKAPREMECLPPRGNGS